MDGERMSNSVKILEEQVQQINRLIKDKDLKYRSRNDFVVKAVENEIRIATLKHDLTSSGKVHFDLLFAEGLRKAFERAAEYDSLFPSSKLNKIKEKDE